jgi:hypothetical protein
MSAEGENYSASARRFKNYNSILWSFRAEVLPRRSGVSLSAYPVCVTDIAHGRAVGPRAPTCNRSSPNASRNLCATHVCVGPSSSRARKFRVWEESHEADSKKPNSSTPARRFHTGDGMMDTRTALLAALVIGSLWSGWPQWTSLPVHPPDGAIAPREPLQTDIAVPARGTLELTRRKAAPMVRGLFPRNGMRC